MPCLSQKWGSLLLWSFKAYSLLSKFWSFFPCVSSPSELLLASHCKLRLPFVCLTSPFSTPLSTCVDKDRYKFQHILYTYPRVWLLQQLNWKFYSSYVSYEQFIPEVVIYLTLIRMQHNFVWNKKKQLSKIQEAKVSTSFPFDVCNQLFVTHQPWHPCQAVFAWETHHMYNFRQLPQP